MARIDGIFNDFVRHVTSGFGASAYALRAKFAEILAKQSQMPLDYIASLVVEMDFAPDHARVQERRRSLAAVPVYYGYDPVYRCTVSLGLASGRELTVTRLNP